MDGNFVMNGRYAFFELVKSGVVMFLMLTMLFTIFYLLKEIAKTLLFDVLDLALNHKKITISIVFFIAIALFIKLSLNYNIFLILLGILIFSIVILLLITIK